MRGVRGLFFRGWTVAGAVVLVLGSAAMVAGPVSQGPGIVA